VQGCIPVGRQARFGEETPTARLTEDATPSG
jgi:hypothetical protein